MIVAAKGQTILNTAITWTSNCNSKHKQKVTVWPLLGLGHNTIEEWKCDLKWSIIFNVMFVFYFIMQRFFQVPKRFKNKKIQIKIINTFAVCLGYTHTVSAVWVKRWVSHQISFQGSAHFKVSISLVSFNLLFMK